MKQIGPRILLYNQSTLRTAKLKNENMKKATLLLLLLTAFLVHAEDEPLFGEFGIKPTHQAEDYQQYVGKTFRYLPAEPLAYAEREVFKFKGTPGEDFILISVEPKSGYVDRYKNITFTFQEKKEKGKKFKVKSWYSMNDALPFLDIEAFEKHRISIVGKTYSHPLVKQSYTVEDFSLKNDNIKNRLLPTYTLSNGIECKSLKGLEKSLFEYALKGSYHSTLVKVEKPEDSSNKFSDVKSVEDKGVTKYSFEDDLIRIIIFGTSTNFSFSLTNKSQNSIKLVWDDAAYVSYNGSTSKIMHSGIKYSQKEASQPSSTIIRGATLDDIACPIDNVRYSDVIHEWITDSMYPPKPAKPNNDVKQIKLMLPIQIKDVVNEYVFIFDIKYSYDHPELLNLE